MGCINSTQTVNSTTKEIKLKLGLSQKIILLIQQGNLKRLSQLISNYGAANIDFTTVHGQQGLLEIDDMIFSTDYWGPVLLAFLHNHLHIAKYFLEELKMNPAVYIVKPPTIDEIQIEQHIKRAPKEKKEYRRYKQKLERYNRVISIIIACKHKNTKAFEFLIDSNLLKFFWSKKDFHQMIHFMSNHSKIWEFAIPLLMQSHLAHRWFFQEKEVNKVDVFYRLQRHFNIKILLDEMNHQLQDQLAKPPYSAAFFISFSNQEFIDDKVPELTQLRECLNNIIQFDFTMINDEVNYYPELKDEIIKRFPHVTSYRELIGSYCQKIQTYLDEIYKINQEIDSISTAITREDIDSLRNIFSKFRIENVNQVSLRVQIPDARFKSSNLLNFALHHNKTQIIDYFLENDMIDIHSSSKRSPTTMNQIDPPSLSIPPVIDLDKHKSNGPALVDLDSNFSNSSQFKNSGVMFRPQSQIADFSNTPVTRFTDSKGFYQNTIDFQTLSLAAGVSKFYESNKQSYNNVIKGVVSPFKGFDFYSPAPDNQNGNGHRRNNQRRHNITLPLEILIQNKQKDLFFKFWDKFIYQFDYLDFTSLLTMINKSVRSEEWYRSFLGSQSTKHFFEALPITERLDFVGRIMKAMEYYYSQTNDLMIQDIDDQSFRMDTQNHLNHINTLHIKPQLMGKEQGNNNQGASTFDLLKPSTMEIISQEPYIQIVFLHCFLSFKKDKRLLELISKGVTKVNYQLKIDFYLEYEDRFQDIAFSIFKERNQSETNSNPAYHHYHTSTLSPYQEYMSIVKQEPLEKLPLLKIQSAFEPPQSKQAHEFSIEIGEQIEKIYEHFFNTMTKKDFLLPHQASIFNRPPLDE